jgi:hypothetical protein
VRLGYGSDDFRRAEVSAGGPFLKTPQGKTVISYRLGLVYQNISDYTDFDDRERLLVLPAFDFQPYENTRLFLDVEYGRLKSKGNGFKDVTDNNPANVINALGLAVSNRNVFNEDLTVARDAFGRDRKFRWSGGDVYTNNDIANVTLGLEQRVLPNLNINAGLNFNKVETERRGIDSQGTLLTSAAVAPTTPGVWFNAGPNPVAAGQFLWKSLNYQWANGSTDKEIRQARIDATYTVEKFGKHTFVLGRQDTVIDQTAFGTAQVTTNLGTDGNRSYVAYNNLAYLRYQGEKIRPWRQTDWQEWSSGHYAVYMGKFWKDRITAVAGYRWDRYMVRQLDYTYVKKDTAQPDSNVDNWVKPTTYDASATSAPGSNPTVEGYRFGGKNQKEESPTAGVSVTLTKDINFYVVNATGVFPNTGQRDGMNNPFQAERTTGVELGLKADMWKDAKGRTRLSASIGAYKIERENAIYNVFWAPQPRSNNRARVRSGVTTGPVMGTGAGAYSVNNSGFQDFETSLPVTYLLPVQYVAAADLNHPRVTGAPQQAGYLFVDYASLGAAASDPIRRAMDAAANDTGTQTALGAGSVGSGATGFYANNGYGLNRNSDVSYDDASSGLDAQIVFSPNDSYSAVFTFAHTMQGVTGGFGTVDQPKSTEYDSWWNYMGIPLDTRRANLDESSYSFVGAIKGVRLIDNPRNIVGMWNKYTFLSGPMKGLDLGLGVSWSASRQAEVLITNGLRSNIAGVENIRRKPRFPAHYTLNAGIGYRTRLSGRPVSVRLNVNNLLNDQKDEALGSSVLYINPATGTTVASTTAGAKQITVPERARLFFAPISFRLTASTSF